jgi:hypothetical protein
MRVSIRSVGKRHYASDKDDQVNEVKTLKAKIRVESTYMYDQNISYSSRFDLNYPVLNNKYYIYIRGSSFFGL